MDRDELEDLRRLLDAVDKGPSETALHDNWEEIIQRCVGARIGEAFDSEPASLSELLRATTGFRSRTGILSVPFEKLSELTSDYQAELRSQLELKSRQMEDVLNETGATYERVTSGPVVRWERAETGRRQYWWTPPDSDVQRAWVDRDLLP